MTPAEERADAIHKLSDVLAIVVTNAPALVDLLDSLRTFPGVTDGLRVELNTALAIILDIRAASLRSLDLFDRLRRVV